MMNRSDIGNRNVGDELLLNGYGERFNGAALRFQIQVNY